MFEDIYKDLTSSKNSDTIKSTCANCKQASFIQSKKKGQIYCEVKKAHFPTSYWCNIWSARIIKVA